jgi:periplasmic divalent cation tolerance protein
MRSNLWPYHKHLLVEGKDGRDNGMDLYPEKHRGLYDKVETAIREVHPYDLPEIIAIDVEKTLPAYADWVREETNKPNTGERV